MFLMFDLQIVMVDLWRAVASSNMFSVLVCGVVRAVSLTAVRAVSLRGGAERCGLDMAASSLFRVQGAF